MINDLIRVCKILPYTNEDEDYIYNKYSGFAMEILVDSEIYENKDIPTLIIGWNKVKKLFPNQNIEKVKISDNLFWTNSISENEIKFKKDINSFFEFSIRNFFNQDIVTYDYFIDGDFKDYIAKNIDITKRSFIYFHKKACYIYNSGKVCIISLLSLEYLGKDYRNIMTSLINKIECTIFSYNNVSRYTYFEELRDVMTTENIFWSKYSYYLEPKEFISMFLGKDIHKYIPFLMKVIREKGSINNDELNSCKRQTKKDRTTAWLSNNKIYFNKDFTPPEKLKLTRQNDIRFVMLKYSDKRTITGRINCVDNFNPQSLPKNSEIRNQIVSRYKGGKIAVFDYKSFETRLSMYLSRNQDFITQNMNSDLHKNTAKAIYEVSEVTDEQRELAKTINHAILYGGGDKLIRSKLSKSNLEDVDRAINNVKIFLAPILNVSEYINSVYKELGYIINPFGTLVKPNKVYAAFNNYVQSTAADIVVDKLWEIKDWLKDKESSFMFQVFDSFVFDISPKDLDAIKQIENILSKYNDMVFDVDFSIGDTYAKC
jgi:hypothetical protein